MTSLRWKAQDMVRDEMMRACCTHMEAVQRCLQVLQATEDIPLRVALLMLRREYEDAAKAGAA